MVIGETRISPQVYAYIQRFPPDRAEILEPRGFTPLLSFTLQNAEKSNSETMISRGSNPLRTHFITRPSIIGFKIGKVIAPARIHCRHQHELGRERNAAGCARDGDFVVFERKTVSPLRSIRPPAMAFRSSEAGSSYSVSQASTAAWYIFPQSFLQSGRSNVGGDRTARRANARYLIVFEFAVLPRF